MEQQKILIFKTNLSTISRFLVAKWMLDRYPGVIKWTLDQSDCDNVLRVVGTPELDEQTLTTEVNSIGYLCEPLR